MIIFKVDLASGMQNQSTSPLLYIPIISGSTPGQLVSSQSFWCVRGTIKPQVLVSCEPEAEFRYCVKVEVDVLGSRP